MFFKPQFLEQNTPVSISSEFNIYGACGYPEVLLQRLKPYTTKNGIETITVSTSLPSFYGLSDRDEGYAIAVTETDITLYGETERARIYAAVTLQQMVACNELYTGLLYDAPDCKFRGYRVNLPSRDGFRDFFDAVDLIVAYKYNAISMEIGGAMEYKRHPEINETWKAFAEETHRYSNRTIEITQGFPWSKNSIHTENAEGDILTQDEVRMLIAYCRERGLEVYPEVPTLSHADYICMAHPELKERAEDPYPDTYCPSNPDTYKIVFDILEEILDVFNPKVVNIGHDELYSMCLCERCRNRLPFELFVEDITKIHDWLAERGVRTMMWGEKLLPIVTTTPNGGRFGGSGGPLTRNGQPLDPHPVLFYAQPYIPKDIIMLHWYYTFGIQYDYVYHTHGLTAVYGNLRASNVKEWRKRRQLGMKGGACSNWGTTHPVEMQRNGQYFDLIYSAYALWSTEYDTEDGPQLERKTFEECFRFRNQDIRNPIEITHTTSCKIPYKPFHCGTFLCREDYLLGQYKICYEDGTEAYFDVVYGENISSQDLSCNFGDEEMPFNPETLSENALTEISGSAMPSSVNGMTYYTTLFENPYPNKTVRDWSFIPKQNKTVTVKNFRIL